MSKNKKRPGRHVHDSALGEAPQRRPRIFAEVWPGVRLEEPGNERVVEHEVEAEELEGALVVHADVVLVGSFSSSKSALNFFLFAPTARSHHSVDHDSRQGEKFVDFKTL